MFISEGAVWGLEAEADVGGEVFYGAEEGVGAALIPVAVEAEDAAEEEVAEVVGYRGATCHIHRRHIFCAFKGIFVAVSQTY